MTSVIYRFEADGELGTASAAATPMGITTHIGRPIRVDSVSYPILAASVSQRLGTNLVQVEVVAEGAGFVDVTLEKSLPDLDQLIAAINLAIAEAFPGAVALPSFVKQATGFAIVNPTAADVSFAFPNSNMQILLFGRLLVTPGTPLTIPTLDQSENFRPSPRLGASHQTLMPEQAQGPGIVLPISGDYMLPVLFYPPTAFRVILSPTSVTARVAVEYPALGNNSIFETPDTQTVVKIVISDQSEVETT